ncbi:beta-galactosidase [Fibrisoma limi BUZ 3]|uniref:Beta-galactosidase n=1 Tax=Fibrisoma limi BUZ 3 TaxID=1185876 RepID=I2GE95_9BACT|nr:sugar-binding domain-containing protein [Fibrisoma limi]CCH52220.1 beta-galactosidase [Fibrisoma limi BUZ 3]
MTRRLTILILLLSSVASAQTTSLNGTWAFRTDPNGRGESAGWFRADYAPMEWDSLPVPGNWDLRNEYAHYAGKGWYRRTLTIPASLKGKTMRLCFEAVYHDSKVWLNGQLLGTNNSGYLPFEFDVTSLLNYGGPNTIVVCADNTFRRGAIWNWGGIRRPVRLEATEAVRIVRQHITPTVDLSKRTAAVSVKVLLQNHGTTPESVQGEVTLSAPNGYQKNLPFTATVPPKQTQEVVVSTNVSSKQVHLWHFDDPFLYSSAVTIRTDKPVVDRFGLRKIEVDNKNCAFKLNGEAIRPMGFNLVPDDRTTGNTLPLWRIKEDIDKLKELGTNLARLTHLPLPKEALDYLDERGIMTFAEIPLWGFDQLADKDKPTATEWLERMIARDFNHPAIIGWSVGNEIGDYPGTMAYVESAIQLAHKLDPNRLAVMVSHTAQRKPDAIQFSDLGLINKYGKNLGQLADQIHAQHPDKVLFYTEYGYGQLQENLDADVDAKAMVDSIRNRPYLIGGSLWTFNDYRSSFIGTKEFTENRPWGVVDVFRQPKKAWHSFRRETAPIRSLTVSNVSRNSATVVLTPRRVLDLPAYTLNGYRLVWKALDRNGRFVQGGFSNLPTINPGEAPIQQAVQWATGSASSDAVQIALISPLNYTAYDTTIYFSKPQSPTVLAAISGRTEQNDLRENSGTVRVTFAPAPMATGYKVRYGTDGLSNETVLTMNPYVDVPKLAFNKTYQIALIAVNPAGESEPTSVRSVKVELDSYVPPAIQYVESADRGFFVGYATQADDYLFQIQYTTKSGDYTNAPILQSDTKGVLFVPNLTNGQPYFFRLRRLKHNNYQTAWSEERTVTPDGGQLPSVPNVQGVIRQPTEVIVCFEPVRKATGYVLEYRQTGSSTTATDTWTKVDINAAQGGYFHLSGLAKNTPYQFRMASLNAVGQSDFSPVIDAQQYAEVRRNR